MTSVPHSGAKSVTPGGSVAGHTPGKWSVAETAHDDEQIPEIVIRAGDHRWVTAVAIGGMSIAEQEANAHLIAAAPELLEALKMYVAWDFANHGGQAASDRIMQARAAISKATAGETRNAEPIHRRDGDEG